LFVIDVALVVFVDNAACLGDTLIRLRMLSANDNLLAEAAVVELVDEEPVAADGGIGIDDAPYLTMDIRCTLLLSMLA
jgi:hypothetical protein